MIGHLSRKLRAKFDTLKMALQASLGVSSIMKFTLASSFAS